MNLFVYQKKKCGPAEVFAEKTWPDLTISRARRLVVSWLTTMTYIRSLASVLTKDLARYERALWRKDKSWVALCNGYERLERDPNGIGVRCDWQWTSRLHAASVVRRWGRGLYGKAFGDFPMASSDTRAARDPQSRPAVSFIVGHRGLDRLPHLLATLKTIAGQEDSTVECIVVEQSAKPEIKERVPGWVRYVHTPLPHYSMPYCRAWAFNVGARQSRGDLLILHDNDLLVPACYAAEHLEYFRRGYEIANLKRFIFYLDRVSTGRFFENGVLPAELAFDSILQNAQGGGSLAIARKTFFAIGGFDEAFVGWGGEDNEFWDRAQLRSLYPYGYLPMVHLWHPGQFGKGVEQGKGLHTADLFEARSRIPPQHRIAELCRRNFGRISTPDPAPPCPPGAAG